MKRLLLLISVILCLASCHKPKDKVVAQVYYHKLYLSELQDNMPTGLSSEDSTILAQHYIDNWIKEQLILHEAEQKLSLREKNFDKQLEEYRNNLLVNAYYDKLVSDTSVFKVSEKEMEEFTKTFDKRYAVDKEIVKLNYVKLTQGSSLIEPVKAILFDEAQRVENKPKLEKMLGDSVEYLVDDETWLYLEDIQNEVSFSIRSDVADHHQYIEKDAGGYHYLMVILDYKNKRSVNETNEEQAAARMMLLNQRRAQFIEKHVDELYQKALKQGAIIQ
ncbi:MAG: hypothetical protein MJZ57_03965 [Bacteroidales bacterium]|nr:hypothetical protein [Bacteroidales bacterium]